MTWEDPDDVAFRRDACAHRHDPHHHTTAGEYNALWTQHLSACVKAVCAFGANPDDAEEAADNAMRQTGIAWPEVVPTREFLVALTIVFHLRRLTNRAVRQAVERDEDAIDRAVWLRRHLRDLRGGRRRLLGVLDDDRIVALVTDPPLAVAGNAARQWRRATAITWDTEYVRRDHGAL